MEVLKELIEELRGRGIKVGITTDGRPEGQKNKIEVLGLEDIDLIITDEIDGTQLLDSTKYVSEENNISGIRK